MPDRTELLFAASSLPQAVIRTDGAVELANDAFRRVTPELGDIVAMIARAHASGDPLTTFAGSGDRAVVLLIAPLGDSAHVVVGARPFTLLSGDARVG